MTHTDARCRPAIGYIVEGGGEHAAYPSLTARIVGAPVYVRAINAEGTGGILRNLEEHLDDMVRTWHPMSVIVTLDLRDVLEAQACTTCVELIDVLTTLVNSWAASRAAFPIMDPMPERLVVVVQIQTFESWWLADASALASIEGFSIEPGSCQWKNVDSEVANPGAFLRRCCPGDLNLKSPSLAKAIMGRVSIEVLAERSRSFRKFQKEVLDGYNRWQDYLLNQGCT
jgi:hypothetical protein